MYNHVIRTSDRARKNRFLQQGTQGCGSGGACCFPLYYPDVEVAKDKSGNGGERLQPSFKKMFDRRNEGGGI